MADAIKSVFDSLITYSLIPLTGVEEAEFYIRYFGTEWFLIHEIAADQIVKDPTLPTCIWSLFCGKYNDKFNWNWKTKIEEVFVIGRYTMTTLGSQKYIVYRGNGDIFKIYEEVK